MNKFKEYKMLAIGAWFNLMASKDTKVDFVKKIEVKYQRINFKKNLNKFELMQLDLMREKCVQIVLKHIKDETTWSADILTLKWLQHMLNKKVPFALVNAQHMNFYKITKHMNSDYKKEIDVSLKIIDEILREVIGEKV